MRQAGTIRPAGSSRRERPEPKSPDRSPLPIFLERHTRYKDGFANLRFLPTNFNSWTLATSRNGPRRPKIRPRKARQLVGRVFLKSRSTSGGRGPEDEYGKGCIKRDRISSCAIPSGTPRTMMQCGFVGLLLERFGISSDDFVIPRSRAFRPVDMNTCQLSRGTG